MNLKTSSAKIRRKKIPCKQLLKKIHNFLSFFNIAAAEGGGFGMYYIDL